MENNEVAQSIGQVLSKVPAREAILWIALGVINWLYLKGFGVVTARLQEENKRLVEEKRDLWDRLDIRVPKSRLNHYNEKSEGPLQ